MNPYEIDPNHLYTLELLTNDACNGAFTYDNKCYYCHGIVSNYRIISQYFDSCGDWCVIYRRRDDGSWREWRDDEIGYGLPIHIIELCGIWLNGAMPDMPFAEFLYRTLGDPV